MRIGGEWLDQIVRLNDVKTAYVFMGMPGGQAIHGASLRTETMISKLP